MRQIIGLTTGQKSTGHARLNYLKEFNFKKYRDLDMSSYKRASIRTKDEFIVELQKLSAKDRKYLNYSYLRSIKRSDLLWEAQKYFGGWRGAVQAAGFRPIQKGWIKKEIIDNIKKIVHEIGYIPKSKEVIKLGYSGLNQAANRRFGSWTNALIEAGFKPFRRNWSKEVAIKELKEVSVKLGHSPSMRELKELNKYDLLNAGLKFFGRYNDFLKAAGLAIVLDMNKWPKQKIISQLSSIVSELGRTPRRSELAAMGRYDLINAVETYLGSWSEGLVLAGYTPNKDVLNDDTTWRDWENLIFDVLKEENVDFLKHMHIKKVGYPDVYIPSERKLIEIKINCSDNSVKEDIKKYLPYCDKLEIWYLFGKPFGILSNKVNFIGPNTIKEKIKHKKELLERFYKIKNGETNVKEKPKKVLVLGSGALYTTKGV